MMSLFNIYYTLPQYLSFIILIFLIISLVEKKRLFKVIGLILTIVLSIFSVYILVPGNLMPGGTVTEKIIMERGGINNQSIGVNPSELIAPYFFYAIPIVPSVLLLFLKDKSKNVIKWLMYSVILLEIIGFFLLKEAIKNL